MSMPAVYYLILDADSQWLASFRYHGDAVDYTDYQEGCTVKEVRLTNGCDGQWCDDQTCPACAGW